MHVLFNFSTQVIVTRELGPKLDPSLRILDRKLDRKAKEEDIEDFIRMTQTFTDAVLKVNCANEKAYENVNRRDPQMNDALRRIMKKRNPRRN